MDQHLKQKMTFLKPEIVETRYVKLVYPKTRSFLILAAIAS